MTGGSTNGIAGSFAYCILQFFSILKFAIVVVTNTTLHFGTLSQLYTVFKRTASAFMLFTVSIFDTSVSDLELTDVYHTKEVYLTLTPHSDKDFRRSKYEKSKSSKTFESKRKQTPKKDKETLARLRKELVQANHKTDQKCFRHIKPHSGLESFNLTKLREQAQLAQLVLPDHFWSKLEDFVLFAASMSECTSYTQASSIFMLYLKTHYDESLVILAAEAFESVFESEVEPQGGTPDWLTTLREGMTNWRTATSNPVFKKISYLISICISLGLCDAAQFEWRVGKFKVFSIPALERHMGAFDLIDAAIETVVYFVEGGYAAFTTGSFTPLLYSDQQAREFDEEFSFLVSNLEHVKTGNLRSFANIDEHTYDQRLSSAITLADSLYRSANGSWEKKIFYDRMMQLRRIKTTFDAIRVQGGLRVAPFTVNFYGKSGVGKSSLSAISMVYGLLANGFSAEDEMLATLNESDKFMSTYRSFVNGIFIDDIGNTKPDFVEKSPTNKIIEICNNVRQYANMAEADMKGKVSIEPKFVNLTTNVKDLGANYYSNEPVSIARRAHITVTVKVRTEFCSTGLVGTVGQQLDAERVAKHYTNEDGVVEIPVVPDLWSLTLERVIPVANTKADTIDYEVVEFEGKKMQDISVKEYLRYMTKMSKSHFVQQERLVHNSNNLASKIPMCSKCKIPEDVCDCLEPHSGFIGYAFGVACGDVTTRITKKLTEGLGKRLFEEGAVLEKMATTKLLSLASLFETSPFFVWTNWIPVSWLSHKYGRRFVDYAMRDEIIQTVRKDVVTSLVLAALSLLMAFTFPPMIIATFILLYRMASITRTVSERVYTEIRDRNDSMPEVFKRVRDNHARYILGACGVLGALYTLLKIWQGFRAHSQHGNLNPKSAQEIEERDAEANPWASVPMEPIPSTDIQRTMTRDQMLSRVHKNQVFLRVKQGEDNRISGAVFLKANLLLMPYHMWFDDANTSNPINEDLYINITRAGLPYDTIVSSRFMKRIEKLDLCIVWVPNTLTYRDITSFLPIDNIRAGLCEMVFRDGNGERLDAQARIIPGLVGHREQQFKGARYELSIPTFCGLCMATFVMHGVPSVIAGFHLGGKTGEPTGVLGTVTQGQVASVITKLAQVDGVLLGHDSGDCQKSLYGEQFYQGSEIHPKSPANFMEQEGNYHVYGSIQGRVSPHSRVVTTIISDTVEEICGVPQQWGSPQFNPAWKPWQESLKYSSNPSIGVEGALLQWAVIDYREPLAKLISREDINEKVKPLTRMQTLCGIDGLRFIDKMPAKTSVGYPLHGPKSEFLTFLDPDDYPEQSFPVELEEQFWHEFDRMKTEYLAGRRCYPIFKGCLKDEPTKVTKDKVRVFQAAPIALQLFVRMYFLPVARVLSMHPLLSECAVGINSQGPEWNQLQQFITQHGEDRIFAGDYSKYDLRMPAQVMFAAFRILIDLAEVSGNYSAEDLKVMRGVASDICHPVVAYNGTLIQLIGSNPSGQNLTVYINSIVNSLLNRCGFLHILREVDDKRVPLIEKHELTFRSAVALMTYGDDVKGSVKEGFDAFNHISYAQFLAQRDMKFTMPDKESTPTPYMSDKDADFLKRKNVYCEDVDMIFGALDEQSIFKSLHSTLRSDFLSPEEQAAVNIDGALREWFAHGRETYEQRREEMKQIASRHQLQCSETSISYDERLNRWKETYLEPQSGIESIDYDKITKRLYKRAKTDIPMKCMGEDVNVIIQEIGEVDLVFLTSHGNAKMIVFVEIKCTNRAEILAKGRRQLTSVVDGMSTMNPRLNYQGVLLSPKGYELVREVTNVSFDNLNLPWRE